MKKYAENHTWISQDGKVATIGITQFAAEEIGEIAYVELPQIGKFLSKDEIACVVESSKAAIDIDSPLAGKVVEINEALKKSPELVNQNPETTGWLYKIEPTLA